MKNSKRKYDNKKKKKRTSKRNKRGVFMVGGMTKLELNKELETITKTTVEEIKGILNSSDETKEEKINKIKIIFKEEYITKFIGTILEFNLNSDFDEFIYKYIKKFPLHFGENLCKPSSGK